MKSTLFLAFLLVLASCRSNPGIRIENAMAAIEGGDYTALIEGCGNQLVQGYTYCRKMEGTSTDEKLYFVAPAVVCKEPPCVDFIIYHPDGTVAYGGQIPKGQTRVGIPWKELVKRSTFEIDDRGFWGYLYEIRFLDTDGNERKVVTQGEIRMRVLREGYIPMHEVKESKDYVWRWKENGQIEVKMTSGGRTYVSERPAGVMPFKGK